MTGTVNNGRAAPAGSSAHRDDPRAFGQILNDTTGHARDLIRGELQLMLAEVSQTVRKSAVYVAMLAGAVVLALTAVLLSGHLVAQALNTVMPEWAAYLVTTVIYAGIAGALAVAGRNGLRGVQLVPHDSIDAAKEDLQWVSTHK